MSDEIVTHFVNAINTHNIDSIYLLMADDHTFIDAHGNEVKGKDNMRAGWTAYFDLFPDYKIEISEFLSNRETFAIFGFASGTYKGNKSVQTKNYWRLPAAWRVITEKGKIKLWQVYADTKVPFDLITY
jgi:ketosteroid isomerase-like protein